MDATLEITLDADFLAATEAARRRPSDIVADLMREFVERERRGYKEFPPRKVEKARQSARAGHMRSNEEVERAFAAKRQALPSAGDDTDA